MTTFYVMDKIEGDECCLFYATTFDEAREKLLAEANHRPYADLSIWTNKGGMVAFMNRDRTQLLVAKEYRS